MNKTNPLLSVIVPLFNTECYIEQCLNSVLMQNIHLELIVVDDGSTDASFEIVDKMSKKDKRILLIRQDNRGVAKARNRGLDFALGEYISFLDCDDWIKPGSLQTLVKEAQMFNSDLVMGNTLFFYSTEQIVERYSIPYCFFGKTYDGQFLFCELMENNVYMPMVYNYIYKKSFLEAHKFRFEDVNHEDEIWTPVTMCEARNCRVIDLSFYYYRQRVGSIMNGGLESKARVSSLLFISKYLYLYACNNELRIDTKLWILVKSIQMLYYSALPTPHICSDNNLLYDLYKIFSSLRSETSIQNRYFMHYKYKLDDLIN